MSVSVLGGIRVRVCVVLLSLGLLISSVLVGGVIPDRAYASTQATFYVSPDGDDGDPGTESEPFRTIAHARDEVRAINDSMTGDVVVYLRGGRYAQDEMLAFTEADSGTNGHEVVYRAYPGETPIISGGLLREGVWTEIDSVKHIYRASVPADLETRQLYVNGVRAVRARGDYYPSGFAFTSTGFTAPSSGVFASMSGWANPADIEFAFKGWDWQFSRCGVASISGSTITMKQPCWNLAQNKHGLTWIENAYELLDSPREWYLDRANDYLYYIPSSEEDMATASVIAPELEALVTVGGTSTTPIQNVQFDGITFADATNLRPNSNDGYPDAQGGIPFGYTFDANVRVSHAEGIGFLNGSFTRMGSEVMYVADSEDITIVGNTFIDNSHRGLQINTTQNFDVSNNVFTKLGVEYFDAVGVRVRDSSGAVEHNELFDLPYTAIERNYAGAVAIRYNYIHDYMLKIHDGGGIYTNTTNPDLDGSGNTLDDFAYNYITRQPAGMAGIYLDDGSKNHYAHDNVIIGTVYSFLAKGSGEIVQNNYTDRGSYPFSCTSCTLSPNHVITNGEWPAAAVSIMNGAGLEPEYQHLKGSDDVLRVPHAEMTAVATNSYTSEFGPENVLDDSSMTMWSTGSGVPQSITLSLGDSYQVSGLEVMPRQDLVPYGNITGYKISTSTDGATFTQVAQGTWADDSTKKAAAFSATEASFVRLEVTAGALGLASAAGIDVVYEADQDLIGNWRLNETSGTSASDSSGNGKTGSVSGGAAWVTGLSGNGLSFNGTDSYVSIPDAADPSALTVSMWVKPAATTAQNLWVRTTAGGATSAFSSQLRINSNGRFQAYMFDGSTKGITGTTTVQAGVWYHVALTASNNGQMQLYVNGQPEGAAVGIGTMWTGGDRYWLGSNSGGGFGWFTGVADEVRLYGKALSGSEISGLFLSPSRLMGSWKLDETSGTTASDSSGNGKTGTVSGGAAWVTGLSNNGLSFNGTDSYVETLDAYDPTAVTVSMWVKPAATTAQNLWVRTDASGATSTWSGQLRITSGGKFEAYMFDGSTKAVTGTTTVQAGVWYHVALTATNNGQMRLYVNGQPEGTAVGIGTMWTGGDRYWLGSNSGFVSGGGVFGWFSGVADEVELYRRALSGGEINSLFESAPRLMGSWKLDETSGTSASDSSGSGKTGTVNGGAAWAAGHNGNGLSFNGVDTYVDIPDPVDPTAVTVSMWVKPAATTAQNLWVRTDASGATSTWSSQLRITSGGKFEAYMYDGTAKAVTGTTAVQAGVWYHVVLTASNGGQMALYVDGQREGAPVAIDAMWTGGTRYWLGSNSGSVAGGGVFGWFSGVMDEVRLYQNAMTESEVVSLYNS